MNFKSINWVIIENKFMDYREIKLSTSNQICLYFARCEFGKKCDSSFLKNSYYNYHNLKSVAFGI